MSENPKGLEDRPDTPEIEACDTKTLLPRLRRFWNEPTRQIPLYGGVPRRGGVVYGSAKIETDLYPCRLTQSGRAVAILLPSETDD